MDTLDLTPQELNIKAAAGFELSFKLYSVSGDGCEPESLEGKQVSGAVLDKSCSANEIEQFTTVIDGNEVTVSLSREQVSGLSGSYPYYLMLEDSQGARTPWVTGFVTFTGSEPHAD